jgi:large subunit ribosomal protein L22
MESRASTRHVRITPQKARLVVDLIRGKRVEDAIGVLEFNPRRASKIVAKTLKSADRQR